MADAWRSPDTSVGDRVATQDQLPWTVWAAIRPCRIGSGPSGYAPSPPCQRLDADAKLDGDSHPWELSSYELSLLRDVPQNDRFRDRRPTIPGTYRAPVLAARQTRDGDLPGSGAAVLRAVVPWVEPRGTAVIRLPLLSTLIHQISPVRPIPVDENPIPRHFMVFSRGFLRPTRLTRRGRGRSRRRVDRGDPYARREPGSVRAVRIDG